MTNKEKFLKECVKQHEKGNSWFTGSVILIGFGVFVLIHKLLGGH